MTLSDLWPGFQCHDIFWFIFWSYLWNDKRLSHSYYRTSVGNHMRSIAWWHFQWPWRTSNPVFKVTAFLKSNISKNKCKKVLFIYMRNDTSKTAKIMNGDITLEALRRCQRASKVISPYIIFAVFDVSFCRYKL